MLMNNYLTFAVFVVVPFQDHFKTHDTDHNRWSNALKCLFFLSKINSKYHIFVTLKHVVYKKVYVENNAYTIYTLST